MKHFDTIEQVVEWMNELESLGECSVIINGVIYHCNPHFRADVLAALSE
jgi:hypothetical protein